MLERCYDFNFSMRYVGIATERLKILLMLIFIIHASEAYLEGGTEGTCTPPLVVTLNWLQIFNAQETNYTYHVHRFLHAK